MRRPASVGLVSPGWPAGAVANGIVSYVANLREGLQEAGVRVSVAAMDCPESTRDAGVIDMQQYPAPGLPRLAVRLAQKLRRDPFVMGLAALGTATAADALVRDQGIELLEIEEAYGFARLVQRMIDLPVVLRLHGPWFAGGAAEGVPRDAAFARRVRAEGLAFRDAFGITAPARQQLELVRDYYGVALPHAAVIPNPAPRVPPSERWRYETCDRRTILCVGRFDRRKGADIMVHAFAQVAREIPDAELCLVGPDDGIALDGQLHKSSAFLDRTLDERARPRAHCLGKLLLQDIPALRRRSFITVVASRYENHPLAVLEAMAYGCPLVAARTGGVPETVRDGETGLLFEPERADQLAQHVIALLRDHGRAQALGARAAQAIARDWSPRAIADVTLAYYGEVLDRYRSRRVALSPPARAWELLRAAQI